MVAAFFILLFRAQGASIRLEPIIIQANKKRPLPKTFTASTLEELKPILPSKNFLGSNLHTLNNEILFSENKSFMEDCPASKLGLKLSTEQKAEGKTCVFLSPLSVSFSLGLENLYQERAYLDNQNTSSILDDDTVQKVNKKSFSYHAGVSVRKEQSLGLIHFNEKQENTLFQNQDLGDKKFKQMELGLSYEKLSYFKPSLNYFNYQNNFASKDRNLPSSQSQGQKLTSVFHHPIDPFNLSTTLEYEELTRTYSELPAQKFQRLNYQFEANTPLHESLESFALIKLDRDFSLENTRTFFIWELGFESKISLHKNLILLSQLSRYEKPLNVQQVFGDGALLLPSQDLNPENGIRLESGPLWEKNNSRAFAGLFFESSQNIPITVATTPSSAKTLSLGGSTTWGAQVKYALKHKNLSFEVKNRFQNPINQNEINWQKGKMIPGRTLYEIDSKAQYRLSNYLFGVRYQWIGAEKIDLANDWEREPYHLGSLFAQFQNKTFLCLFEIKNLLNTFSNNLYSFSGQAGNILEPFYPLTEIKLTLEVVL